MPAMKVLPSNAAISAVHTPMMQRCKFRYGESGKFSATYTATYTEK